MIVVFTTAAFGAKPDMGKIWEFGLRVDFDPSFKKRPNLTALDA